MHSWTLKFCRITSTTWEEANRKYPEHTNPERLESFAAVFTKSKKIPPSFQAYCEGALQSATRATDIFTHQQSKAHLVEDTIFSTSFEKFRAAHATYMGAKLFVANVQKVRYNFYCIEICVLHT